MSTNFKEKKWISRLIFVAVFWLEGGYILEDAGEDGIILGENSAGHCFVLKDLTPVRILK